MPSWTLVFRKMKSALIREGMTRGALNLKTLLCLFSVPHLLFSGYWVVFSGGCLISLFYCIWVQCMCSKFTFLCLFPPKVLNGINWIKFRIRKRLSCGFQYKFLAEFARKPISMQYTMIKTCHRIPGEKNMSLEPCCVTGRNSVYRMLAFLCMWKI